METTMETKKRTFDETRRLAGHLGRKLKVIEEKMDYSRHISGKSGQLLAIHTAMTLLAETPNASVNAEALQAFDRHVDEAVESIRAWAKEQIAPDGDGQSVMEESSVEGCQGEPSPTARDASRAAAAKVVEDEVAAWV